MSLLSQPAKEEAIEFLCRTAEQRGAMATMAAVNLVEADAKVRCVVELVRQCKTPKRRTPRRTRRPARPNRRRKPNKAK